MGKEDEGRTLDENKMEIKNVDDNKVSPHLINIEETQCFNTNFVIQDEAISDRKEKQEKTKVRDECLINVRSFQTFLNKLSPFPDDSSPNIHIFVYYRA